MADALPCILSRCHVSNPHYIRTGISHSADLMDRKVCPARTCQYHNSSCLGGATHPKLTQTYALHQRVFNASTISRQRKLKADILATKKELSLTSAQDQFAKWAKLKRSVEKGMTELEKISCVSSKLCVPTCCIYVAYGIVSIALTASIRWRAVLEQNSFLTQIQHLHLDPDNGTSICRRILV